jgi:hypothetical protein
MGRMLSHVWQWVIRRMGRRPPRTGLTEIEYEAISLIAYEGRDAYARAREQAEYCRRNGSPKGVLFWSSVAAEVGRRTGRQAPVRH